VAATATLTWYGVHEKRGFDAMAEHGILPNRTGVLVHDCWAPYWKLDSGLHALCNAHLLRELTYVQQLTGQAWPSNMTNLLRRFRLHADAILRASSPTRRSRFQTTSLSVPCACPRSNKKSPAASVASGAPTISASSAPASTPFASKGTTCSMCCAKLFMVRQSRRPHSG